MGLVRESVKFNKRSANATGFLCALKIFFGLLFFAITVCTHAITEPVLPVVVSVKKPELKNNTQQLSEVDVINLALEKTKASYGPFELRPIPPMNRARTLSALNNNIYPNLVMMMSYEDDMVAKNPYEYIDIPIDFGANSYRICFMRPALKAKLKSVQSIDELRRYTFGAGIGWLDIKILRHHGFKVIEQTNVQSLIRMTKAGRVDFFCRGFNEIFNEIKNEPETEGLSYDESFLLYYPLPKFLFANSNNSAILKRIQQGLVIAEKDGSLHKLWMMQNKENIAASQFNKRRIFRLSNPYIKNLPTNYQQYYFDPHKPTAP
ncbi:hypothetical protein GCM10011613_12850 [Cellvibrio zantedeschiae]|uniref:Solute-binding protein family 3/N-terminal domain-containing protein n=1 Tax=Cellvibrio zantedeschiae TaxID=1237077 RepID=A0ABQ3B0F4_9GAMM|nr:hypothetical protein [Cellvibrio zantedeschiae]GGY69912.1 hypothetical protein GCM10011613_12850 [Cellvibrio zantedeschiae]